jgi:ADP-ribose pyrophosphatase YjhB (NUDIX family)
VSAAPAFATAPLSTRRFKPFYSLSHVSSFFNDSAGAPRPNQPRCASVLALIEDDAGRLLLEHRSDAPAWSLIGGAVEHDETFTDALRREVYEETGLRVAHYEFFGTFSSPARIISYSGGAVFQLASLAYSVRVADTSELRVSAESTELRFFARSELPPKRLAATQQPIIERYLSGIQPPFLD